MLYLSPWYDLTGRDRSCIAGRDGLTACVGAFFVLPGFFAAAVLLFLGAGALLVMGTLAPAPEDFLFGILKMEQIVTSAVDKHERGPSRLEV